MEVRIEQWQAPSGENVGGGVPAHGPGIDRFDRRGTRSTGFSIARLGKSHTYSTIRNAKHVPESDSVYA